MRSIHAHIAYPVLTCDVCRLSMASPQGWHHSIIAHLKQKWLSVINCLSYFGCVTYVDNWYHISVFSAIASMPHHHWHSLKCGSCQLITAYLISICDLCK